MNTLLNHLYRNRHSVVELLCVISAIEGKLMEMSTFKQSDINCVPDHSGTTGHDYLIFEIAECLGETFELGFIPENYRHYFDDVISQGKKAGKGVWDTYFHYGVTDVKYTRSGFSDEAAHIKYLSESKVIRLVLSDQCVRLVPNTECKPLLEGCLMH
ncbi:hypothetical protein JFY74_04600 [Pectobacterium carotovorum]|uniref:hypothetical protein n=1 Tax=Pectobacterium TaxID=122277 RepID=UPI0018EC9878|nr:MULTISPECIES: hypothetical protein [Pectobacterium]MCU1793471.1 hypothetical protein [Pectobacterium polaris]QQG29350.1 hypothetical protein JFY74_04600 [Pectobacterium carotovorum]